MAQIIIKFSSNPVLLGRDEFSPVSEWNLGIQALRESFVEEFTVVSDVTFSIPILPS